MSVTCSMVADCVEAAFDHPPVERAVLLKVAIDARALVEVLDVLHSLPGRNYGSMRELWPFLARLPVE